MSATRTATGSDPVIFLADGGRVLGSLRPAYALQLGFDAGQRVRELRYEFKPGVPQPSLYRAGLPDSGWS